MEPRGLDLETPLMRARVLGEDLEDDLGPVEDSGLECEFEVSLLPRAQVFVADDNVVLALNLQVAQ